MVASKGAESGTCRPESTMKALHDTEGMPTPQRAAFWIEEMSKTLHRGPKVDTWTAARVRVAKYAGIERSMAKRIWQRWEEMRDVSGCTMIRLMVAYEKLCVSAEDRADALERELKQLRAEHEIDQSRGADRRRSGVPDRREASQAC